MNNIVAITQPDFFPWLGSIEKISACHTFIFLNHVTNRPNDGLWTKRVKILINGEPKWMGVPLKKDPEREFVPIREMLIDDEGNFINKHLSSISHNYGKAPFYEEIFPLIEETYNKKFTRIEAFNRFYIESLCKKLEVHTPICYSHELNPTMKSNELLIELVKKVNGDAYLFGIGSLDYLNPSLWEQEQLHLIPQNFTHPMYPQFNRTSFEKGLSVIDALMNCGYEETSKLLRKVKDLE